MLLLNNILCFICQHVILLYVISMFKFSLQLFIYFVLFFVWQQIDIGDSYQTLTNKTITAIMWAIGYCGRHFTFLLKTDDNSFNVLQHFVEYLDSLVNADLDDFAFVGGFCSSGEVPHGAIRNKRFIPDSSYPGPVFPLHCKVRTLQQYISITAEDDFLFNLI